MDTGQEFVRQMIVTKNGFLMELFLTFNVFIPNVDAQRKLRTTCIFMLLCYTSDQLSKDIQLHIDHMFNKVL